MISGYIDKNTTKSSCFIDGVIYNAPNNGSLEYLYKQYGVDCVKHLNGDFSFVLYDADRQCIYGAVDRLGIKTLYYYFDEKSLGFGTALLPLCRELTTKNIPLHIDTYGRQCYFAMQYIPSPHSIIKEIKKLNPGEYFVYSLKTGQMHTNSYWDLYDNTCGYAIPQSYSEAVNRTDALIQNSISNRITNHTKGSSVGTFLSGGIDSSLVTMYAAHQISNLECFSVGFSDAEFDESLYAQKVADILGVKHNHIQCTPKDALHILDGLQSFYDEPMGDASMIPTSLLCEVASQSIQFALGGDGGDEVFMGYPRYLRYASYQPLYTIPAWIRNWTGSVCGALGKKRLSQSLKMNDVKTLYMNRRPSNSSERFDAIQLQRSIPQCQYLYAHRDLCRCFNDFDIKTVMCHEYNVKVDRAAYRANLPVSAPLLDYCLVEYSRLLPTEYCISKHYGQKRILRELLYKELPKELFERKKQGFAVPIRKWFREEMKDYVIDMLNERTINILPDFDGQTLLKMRDEHLSGHKDWGQIIWLCVNYIAWYKMFSRIITLCD